MAEPSDQKVPEIRCHGYDDEWREYSLDKLKETDFTNGVFNDPAKVGRGYRLINVKDMYAGNCIDVEGLTRVAIDEAEFRANKVEHGDIFFTRSSLVMEGIAYSNVYLGSHNDITFDGHLIRMRPDKTITDPLFLAIRFKTNSARIQFIAGGKTTTMTTIGQSDIAEVKVFVPTRNEQIQIGAYFKSLDRMIGLHQRKHDKLVTLKQAMLQKMFPQDGATTPEIRFKGFDEPWEERELLKDVTKIIDFRGRTPKKLGLDWSEKGYLALSAVNVKNGYIDFSVDAHFGDDHLYNVWMKGSELHKGQVLFTTEAPMGNVAQVPDDQKYILSQRTIAFEVDNESLLEDFLAVLLRTPFMFRKLSSLSSGGTAKGVSQRSLESVTSVFPTDINEQQKIGTYFSNLDDLISKHATQLEKLKNIKSACLEKMFV